MTNDTGTFADYICAASAQLNLRLAIGLKLPFVAIVQAASASRPVIFLKPEPGIIHRIPYLSSGIDIFLDDDVRCVFQLDIFAYDAPGYLVVRENDCLWCVLNHHRQPFLGPSRLF